jgi:uncharacterized protein YjbI with pentapeptide repeats
VDASASQSQAEQGSAGRGESSAHQRRPVKDFLHRQRDDLIRDGLLGVGLAVVAFLLAMGWDARAADRQEMLENTRFVRERSGDGEKPFQGLYLRNASLSGLELSNARFQGADLRGTSMTFTMLENAVLQNADLSGANAFGGDFSNATLMFTDFSGTDLRHAQLPETIMDGTNFADADLERANLSGAEAVVEMETTSDPLYGDMGLDPADIPRPIFTGANLAGANLSDAKLSNADFSGANFRSANLSGADLSNAILPNVNELQEQRPCFDEHTRWPAGFQPPAEPRCDNWADVDTAVEGTN